MGLNHAGEDAAFTVKYFLVDDMEHSSQPCVTSQPLGRIVNCNAAFCDLIGYAMEDLFCMVQGLGGLCSPAGYETMVKVLDRLRHRREPWQAEIELLHQKGFKILTECFVLPVMDGSHSLLYQWLITDVSERKQEEERLQSRLEDMQAVLQVVSDTYFLLDIQSGTVLDWKIDPADHLLVPVRELQGMKLKDCLPPRVVDRMRWTFKQATRTGISASFEYVHDDLEGERFYEVSLTPCEDRMVVVFRDVSRQKRVRKRLEYLSMYDVLTGLNNRTYFENEVKWYESMPYAPASIIICDIDGLKMVNDTLGHEAGDALLCKAAAVLRNSLRQGDVVARIGGDEFAILLPTSDTAVVEGICRRIREGVDRENRDNPELYLGISLGYAISDDIYASLEDVFRDADKSMYRDKIAHKGTTRRYIVRGLMQTLAAKKLVTVDHIERLKQLVTKLALAMGLDEVSIGQLELLAEFHDIGKVGIASDILMKAGSQLTSEEFREVQRHCHIGRDIARSVPELASIADWILQHHEWWNGQGYPLGLKGEEIPLECRILAVADVYDIMTHEQCYRKAFSSQEAVKELRKGSGTQFDPQVLAQFIQLLPELVEKPNQEP